MTEDVLAAIPHRSPFLFVDKIIEIDDKSITTEKTVRTDEDFFKGHYPGNPIMPGVLICESIFQSAAIYISKKIIGDGELGGSPVLTRIKDAKFKNMVLPGDTLELKAEVIEVVSGVYFMKGVARVRGKVAVRVEFAVTIAK